ncbi:SCO family protein [Virgibacillus oceani]
MKVNSPLKIEDFTFINQDNEVGRRVWVANFIFTNCVTVCPPMTSNMADLQSQLSETGFYYVNLISFTVDPKKISRKH